jgi:hypothetical protein
MIDIRLSEDPSRAPLERTSDRKRIGRPRKALTEEARERKRHEFLERNRIAAGKCRLQKKVKVETLEERYQILKNRNTALKELRGILMGEVQSLRGLASFGCLCSHGISGNKIVDTKIEEEQQDGEEGSTTMEESIEGLRKDSGFSEWNGG